MKKVSKGEGERNEAFALSYNGSGSSRRRKQAGEKPQRSVCTALKLCYSAVEADDLSGAGIAGKATAIPDRQRVCKDQGFNIGRMYVAIEKEMPADAQGAREVYLICVAGVFRAKGRVRGDPSREVEHGQRGKDLLSDVLRLF